MKSFLVFPVLIALAACSSAKKNTESAAENPPAAESMPTTNARPDAEPLPSAKKSTSGGLQMVECKQGSDSRKLEILEKNGGCELQYLKMGKAETVATQKVGTAKCDEVLERIHKKLTAAGYECNG